MSHPNLTEWFQDIFQRLLAGEDFAHHQKDLSGLFEVIASNLFGEFPIYKGCYFDGFSGVTLTIQPPRALELLGEMWVGRDRDQWTESFRAKVVDKRGTRQGIWITVWLGENRAESESAFALQRFAGRKVIT
jgi:hypothetical protein